MPDAIACAGCASKLAVPVGAAGRALRCPRCGTHTSVPVPPPEPPPRVRAAVVRDEPEPEEDDPPPRRRRRDDDWDARPRRRNRKAGVPGWLWALGGTFAVVLLLLGVFVSMHRNRDVQPDAAQGGAAVAPASPGPALPPVPVVPLEVLPAGWERVSLPGTKMTLLMPQGPAPEWAFRQNTWLAGWQQVNRGIQTAADDDIHFSAGYVRIQAGTGGAAAGAAGVRQLTVAGYPAQLFARPVIDGEGRVTLRLVHSPDALIDIAIVGKGITAEHPYVKRAHDSISFTLPPKAAPPVPIDYDPPWTRRFAPGQAFSIDLPGRGRPPTAAVNPNRAFAWQERAELPRRENRPITFTVAGIGSGVAVDPRKSIEQELDFRARQKTKAQLVRRVELDRRPGYMTADPEFAGEREFRVVVQDTVVQYTLTVRGAGLTTESPEVKRCLDSVSFTTPPPAAVKK